MAYPPTIPPDNRDNTTAQQDNHASDHNVASNALTDIVSEIDATKTDVATNSGRITGNDSDIANLQAADTTRNQTFTLGTSPIVQGSGTTSQVKLRSGYRPASLDDTGADRGDIYASAGFAQNKLGAATTLSGTYKDVTGEVSASTASTDGFNAMLNYAIDVECTSAGTMVAALFTNNVEDGVAPQIVAKMQAGDRMCLSNQAVNQLSNSGSKSYELRAKANSGAFTVAARHTNIAIHAWS